MRTAGSRTSTPRSDGGGDSTPRSSDSQGSPRGEQELTLSVDVNRVIEETGLQEELVRRAAESPHSVWRSLKAKKMLLEIVAAGEDELCGLMSRVQRVMRDKMPGEV